MTQKDEVSKRLGPTMLAAMGLETLGDLPEDEAKKLLTNFIINWDGDSKVLKVLNTIIESLYPQYLEMVDKLLMLK